MAAPSDAEPAVPAEASAGPKRPEPLRLNTGDAARPSSAGQRATARPDSHGASPSGSNGGSARGTVPVNPLLVPWQQAAVLSPTSRLAHADSESLEQAQRLQHAQLSSAQAHTADEVPPCTCLYTRLCTCLYTCLYTRLYTCLIYESKPQDLSWAA